MFTLQTVAAQGEGEGHSGAAQADGFSLHAGVSIKPGQRTKLEWLCRYVSRGPLAQDRLALGASGQVRYARKTPWRDGTTHAVLEPLDFIARLAALVAQPRRHLTRYHGVFAPHIGLRALITRAGRCKGSNNTERRNRSGRCMRLARRRVSQRCDALFGGRGQIERTPCAGAATAGWGVLRSTIGARVRTRDSGGIWCSPTGLAG